MNTSVYTNKPLNYADKKNGGYKWKPVILISILMISMFIVKNTVKPKGTFGDIAVMAVSLRNPPEENLINENIYFPLDGEVTSVFAVRNDPFGSGETESHEGLDIAVIDSSDIVAVMDGIVRTVGNSNGYGNYIVIRHSDEMETLYAHCDKIYSKTGDKIYAGDIIAKAGSTGRSTAPHLHFEVRINGEKVDPLPYLNR